MDVELYPRNFEEQASRSAREADLAYEVALDRRSLLDAFGLIYTAYRSQQLTRANRLHLRILPHQLLETSTILVARRARRTIGTLSLVEDGDWGVPLDSLYVNEVAKLRGSNRRLAELTCLATEQRAGTVEFMVLRKLLWMAVEQARARQLDELLICVHPRHRDFYQRRLGFTPFGPERRCPWVCGRPAVAMRRRLATGVALGASNAKLRRAVVPYSLPCCATRAAREQLWELLAEASPVPRPVTRFAAA